MLNDIKIIQNHGGYALQSNIILCGKFFLLHFADCLHLYRSEFIKISSDIGLYRNLIY